MTLLPGRGVLPAKMAVKAGTRGQIGGIPASLVGEFLKESLVASEGSYGEDGSNEYAKGREADLSRSKPAFEEDGST